MRSMPIPRPPVGRHAVFHRVQEVLVHRMRFLIARRALSDLLDKPLPLVDGVVYFGECVARLLGRDVRLEPACQPGVVLPLLGERRRSIGKSVTNVG
jgi:hypothetical protein